MGIIRKASGAIIALSGWIEEHPIKFTGYWLAAAIASGICAYAMTRPEGVPLKAEADGIITYEEEQEITSYLSSTEKESSYSKELSGLVNDYSTFLDEKMGWTKNPIRDGLHIKIASNEEIADDCESDEWYGGCYSYFNSTIYLEETSPYNLFAGIQHEIGHSLRETPERNPYLSELPSQANEFYAFFRLYSLNTTIGIVFALETGPTDIRNITAGCSIDKRRDEYMLGAIGFLVQANKENGNLELAMNNVLSSAESALEKDTRKAIEGYNTICSAYLGEYEKLLSQPGFLESMAKGIGIEKAKDFISIQNLEIILARIQLGN